MRSGASQQMLRYEFRFGGVPNPVVQPGSHGLGDGAYGCGGLAAVAEAEGDLEVLCDGSHFVEIFFGHRPGADKLGGMAALLQVFEDGSKGLWSHGGCGIQFQVEAARDLHGSAGLTDPQVDFFELVEAGVDLSWIGRNHGGVAADAFPSAE